MISKLQKDIVVKAIKIRLKNGEDIEAIMSSYIRLTQDERDEIATEIANFR